MEVYAIMRRHKGHLEGTLDAVFKTSGEAVTALPYFEDGLETGDVIFVHRLPNKSEQREAHASLKGDLSKSRFVVYQKTIQGAN